MAQSLSSFHGQLTEGKECSNAAAKAAVEVGGDQTSRNNNTHSRQTNLANAHRLITLVLRGSKMNKGTMKRRQRWVRIDADERDVQQKEEHFVRSLDFVQRKTLRSRRSAYARDQHPLLSHSLTRSALHLSLWLCSINTPLSY